MEEKRFSGKTGEEYELFKLVCPHFDELEGLIGKTITDYFSKSNQTKISVLEIGVGPGYTSDIILSADPRVKLLGIDNGDVMVEQAKVNLKSYILQGRAELVKGDALIHLQNVPSNSYDVFASGFTLHNFSGDFRYQVLKEIYRVLKPSGLFVNADKYAHDNGDIHNLELAWQLNQFDKKYTAIGRQDLKDEWTKHYIEDNNPLIIMRESDSLNLLKEVGFKNERVLYRNHMDALVVGKK